MRRILIAEDENTLREGIAMAFREGGWQVAEAPDGGRAVEILQRDSFDVLVTDHRMPVHSGLEVLQVCRRASERTAVVVMTAYGTVESAVEAMRAGAFDYILKPFELEELELKVQRSLEHRRLLARLEAGRLEAAPPGFEGIVAESPAMKEILRRVRKVAPSTATVLILGETGTGKERVAEALHRGSDRADRPFVKLNCAALPEGLLESELFGHERGAFTGADRRRTGRFELADEGTLFLDEIGCMSPSTQVKVLRFLQEREFERVGGSATIKVDVRLVAATNRHLEEAVSRGEFREDLFYRLDVVTLKIPPLRERPEDIVPLARLFASRFSSELKKDPREFDEDALRAMARHPWPGNVRELENTIERAVLLSERRLLTGEDLGLAAAASPHPATASMRLNLPPDGIRLADLEKLVLLEALRLHGWVQKDAAKFLGISARAMNYKVARHRITHKRWIRNGAAVCGKADA